MCLAKPLELISIDADTATGIVSAGGSTLRIGLDLVPEAEPGDYVLVHAGMAIELLEDQDASALIAAYEEFVVAGDRLIPGTSDEPAD